MNVARLNFSHGDHEGHGQVVKRLKEAFKIKKNQPVALLLDTKVRQRKLLKEMYWELIIFVHSKGPEIRTGLVKDQSKKLINLIAGQELEISKSDSIYALIQICPKESFNFLLNLSPFVFLLATDYNVLGDEKILACSYKSLPNSVKIGSSILIADGSLVCIVKEIKETSVIVTVTNSCSIGEKKNMNLPGAIIDLPTVTSKDEDDILNFGLKHGIDMIALSFTRKAEDIEYVRDILGP